MNKRQRKKQRKKDYERYLQEIDEEFSVCQECDKKLDLANEYHRTFRTCDVNCHMSLVGMSWRDFV